MSKVGESTTGTGENSGGTDVSSLILDRITALHQDVSRQISEINTKNKELNDSIQTFKDEIRVNLGNIRTDIKKIDKETTALRRENEFLKKKLSELQASLSENVQFTSYNKIRISNVPLQLNVDIEELILRISKIINFEFQKEKIQDFYRPKMINENFKPPILFNFIRIVDKKEFLNCYRRYIKNKNKLTFDKIMGNEETSEVHTSEIFISEHMSPNLYKLFRTLREYKFQGTLKYVWFINNRIWVRKDDGTPSLLIKSKDDFHKFLAVTPSLTIHDYSDDEEIETDKSEGSRTSVTRKRLRRAPNQLRLRPFLQERATTQEEKGKK
uniref:FP protein C-terminal domain-containing protein n=1 Tax=Rhodnius prolixus TaxID=13249 RepID=T1HSV5_RHOPR